MMIRHALLVTAIAAVGLAGCSSPPSKTAVAKPPPPTAGAGDPTGAVAAGPKPFDHFGDGTFEVLTDIKPGKYKTAGGPGEPPCYWARLKDLQRQVTSNIATGYGNKGPDIVMIEPGDMAFESRGCGEWRLVP